MRCSDTTLRFLGAIFIFILLASGCNGGPPAESPTAPGPGPTGERPQATATSLPAEGLSGEGCFVDVPTYPGAKRNRGEEGHRQEVVEALAGGESWLTEVTGFHVYETNASTDEVLEFYEDEMPKHGWENTSWVPRANWGVGKWKKDWVRVQLLTGLRGGRTLILVGCHVHVEEPTPTPRVIPVRALTMKQAFDLLREESGAPDLAFYGYQAFDVDKDGRSSSYTISGYSAGQKRFCYISSREDKVQLSCRDQDSIDEPLVEDLTKLKDSPEFVAEAFQKYAPCPDSLAVSVNLTQSEVQFLCTSGDWSGEVSPYK